ncbi:MAG: asparaginase [Thermoleophilia bacterium]|nr:asparaginase [Thermoleophilia bacterium]
MTLITTGGTIEKTYDEASGTLENRVSIVGRMLEALRLEQTTVGIVDLMAKDSLHMTDADRDRITQAVSRALAAGAATSVVVLHGTDTLCTTGELLHARLGGALRSPVVLTGAMRPFEMVRSDALQNLTEAVFATGLLAPGVYCVCHGRALRFPGVTKDRARGTFVSEALA